MDNNNTAVPQGTEEKRGKRPVWRSPIKAVRYRLGSFLLRPLGRQIQAALRNTPPIEISEPPPIGAPDTFAERQEWAKRIVERDALSDRIKAESNGVGDLLTLGHAWPYEGWEQVLWNGLHDAGRTLHPVGMVYNVAGLDRAAERIQGLKERNDGLTDLVKRLYQHFLDEMPADLAEEIADNLRMERRSILTTSYEATDEGWQQPVDEDARS